MGNFPNLQPHTPQVRKAFIKSFVKKVMGSTASTILLPNMSQAAMCSRVLHLEPKSSENSFTLLATILNQKEKTCSANKRTMKVNLSDHLAPDFKRSLLLSTPSS